MAQQTEDTSANSEPLIVVTGSRIARPEESSPNPDLTDPKYFWYREK